MVVPIVAVAIVGAGCGGDDDDGGDDTATATSSAEAVATDTPGAPTEPGEDGEIAITAESVQFSTGRIEMTAGVETTITLTNLDTSIPHNIHVIGGGVDESFDPFTGEQGPTMSLTLTIDEPGEYTFQCDVHPGVMNGTVVVTG